MYCVLDQSVFKSRSNFNFQRKIGEKPGFSNELQASATQAVNFVQEMLRNNLDRDLFSC